MTNSATALGGVLLITDAAATVAVDPAYIPDSTVQYSKQPGIGNTGLYYRNTNNDTDELISKNKALLFSMIF